MPMEKQQIKNISIHFSLIALYKINNNDPRSEKSSSFQYGPVKLVQKCFPKPLHMWTTWIKYDKDTVEDSRKRKVNMEQSEEGIKKVQNIP